LSVAGWQAAPHHLVATCNDCHTPAGFISKYVVKAQNGWHHSLAFTLGDIPDVIRARPESRAVVEANCRHCHADLVDSLVHGGDMGCIRCHAFALVDQENTKRNIPAEAKQSGNCMHCHASIMPLYRKLGKEALPQAGEAEQIQKGLEAVGQLNYWDAHKELEQLSGGKAHPVSCVDCHEPKSMELRVTRPGFITGIQKLAAAAAAVPHLASIERWRRGDKARPYDPNLDGTRQEKRAYVCGQCHVEYFCGKGQTLFFPWGEGLKVEEMEHLYDGMQVGGKRFKDWVHAETGMEVLKAQHPEFEMWSQGIHARAGVACADCHMPYMRDGAQKISEHWVRSPLLSLNRSCATCHPNTDDELKARETLSKKDDFLKAPKEEQDKKLAAENSMGFHAPQEMARLLAESIDLSRQAQIKAGEVGRGKLAMAAPPPEAPKTPGK
jgi:nitrite reductase (cytochrome c-552)